MKKTAKKTTKKLSPCAATLDDVHAALEIATEAARLLPVRYTDSIFAAVDGLENVVREMLSGGDILVVD